MSHRRPPAPIPHPHGPVACRLRALRFPLCAFFRSPFRLPPSAFPRRTGLTLIEMLVALAVTLVMMAAVVNLFANLSGSIRNRRAMIEAGAQLRQVRTRLQLDLAGATCAGRTWIQPAENRGYIEYIEGSWSDSNPSPLLVDGDGDNRPDGIDFATSLIPSGGDPTMRTPNTSSLAWAEGDVTNAGALGDFDDLLALTVRSESEPFTAQYRHPVTGNTETVQSPLAEVLWFAVENPADDPATPQDETLASGTRMEPGMRRLYRRVALIAPWLGPWSAGANAQDYQDISVRVVGNQVIANTLGDLTKREYRLEHRPNFPHEMSGMVSSTSTERLVLNDLLGFDVRIFDPGAPVFQTAGGTAVQPGDPGWQFEAAEPTPVPSNYGAYVDLGWAFDRANPASLRWPRGPSNANELATVDAPMQYWLQFKTAQPNAIAPVFNVPHQVGWHPRNRTAAVGFPAVYDTWSFHYENDGINHDSAVDPVVDQGTNGLDDPVIYDTPLDVASAPAAASQRYGVDDVGERETAPPYDTPLLGLQVRFRIYEPDARQVREASVTQSFTP